MFNFQYHNELIFLLHSFGKSASFPIVRPLYLNFSKWSNIVVRIRVWRSGVYLCGDGVMGRTGSPELFISIFLSGVYFEVGLLYLSNQDHPNRVHTGKCMSSRPMYHSSDTV